MPPAGSHAGPATLADLERRHIEATLARFAGNKRRAADALGCSVKTLYNKLNRYAQAASET
jgi:DNA-binding NtrC family response regulator